jgi:hypothetical protein
MAITNMKENCHQEKNLSVAFPDCPLADWFVELQVANFMNP